MRVLVFPSDNNACGMYRLRWPTLALQEQGYEVKIAKKNPAVIIQNNEIVGLAENLNADVVVFQRPARRQYLQAFKYFQKEGIKVCVDMDDDLTTIHPKNPAYQSYNFHGDSGDMHWKFCTQACEMADIVTVTTPRLQAIYGGAVVPNCIPESYLNIKSPENELVTVGWAGITATHPEDLQITHGAINQAIAGTKDKSRFLALGDQETLIRLGVRQREPNGWQEGVKINQYAEFISQLDIGIVPLEDTLFNQAKSWLKALEYASVGVVPVVSPTPDNMRMVNEGAAVVARNPRDWAVKVKSLIEDDEYRQEMASRARKFAAEWTIEKNTATWAKAWGLELI
jgi:glycosyltransferase involved in cell wall biosynthesis